MSSTEIQVEYLKGALITLENKILCYEQLGWPFQAGEQHSYLNLENHNNGYPVALDADLPIAISIDNVLGYLHCWLGIHPRIIVRPRAGGQTGTNSLCSPWEYKLSATSLNCKIPMWLTT
ncbi:hypothetical protein FVEG_11960 [Fusarium verticillioides 7600]|uniref:Uncharacterized protein n=1 Tax=Gibberella moniliformis (strain M3125 / FGSC 7600) TaxID=334819 RepID=W7N0B5_GIBM7|nr:hypothetical protein FVEG_11960 [Fusarium verticillioides 7600]EWG53555.1 hypothetical protein FVEG_11960 [Fusarium verticillioides 7600]